MIFGPFLNFFVYYPPISEILVSIQRKGCGKLPYIREYAHFFFNFGENYPPKSEFLGSVEIKNWVNIFCISGYPLFLFYAKSYESQNCQVFVLLTVFWTFLDTSPANFDIMAQIKTLGC